MSKQDPIKAARALREVGGAVKLLLRALEQARLATGQSLGDPDATTALWKLEQGTLEILSESCNKAADAFEEQDLAWSREEAAHELAGHLSPTSKERQTVADLEWQFAERAQECEGEARAALDM